MRNRRAVRELQQYGWLAEVTKLRSSKYLNNLVEQDHRNVKSRLGVILGMKSFALAATRIRGAELMHRIRKGQFYLGSLARAVLPGFSGDSGPNHVRNLGSSADGLTGRPNEEVQTIPCLSFAPEP